MEPSSTDRADKVYLVTRDDLSAGQQITQTAHALSALADHDPDAWAKWRATSDSIIALAVTGEQALLDLAERARAAAVSFALWRERDLCDEVTAIAFAPSTRTSDLCAGMTLAGRTDPPAASRRRESSLRRLTEAMTAVEQTAGMNLLEHGQAVRETYLAVLDFACGHADPAGEHGWRLPSWVIERGPELSAAQMPQSVAERYLTMHDCGHGLLVRDPAGGPATQESFRQLTGSADEWSRWQGFYADCLQLARAVAPTMLEPVPTAADVRERLGDDRIWNDLVTTPIGETVAARLRHDTTRGIALTDGLIGTFSPVLDPTMQSNRCFWYHVIGNETGQWRVPVGGMGALTAALRDAVLAAGGTIACGRVVTAIDSDGRDALVTCADGSAYAAAHVVHAGSPAALARICPSALPHPRPSLDGAQMKVNMLLHRLPRLKDGTDPQVAFAGTFHFDESYTELERAYQQAAAGHLPDAIPAEMYCHSLTDPTILGPQLRASGHHTLTMFGLHTPAALFDRDNAGTRQRAADRMLDQLDAYLADPIRDCLAIDAHGQPCLEAKSPIDLEADLGLPRGNIFHADLQDPFADADDPAGPWGVSTAQERVLLAGAGARRGGGVSGIPGRSAAMSILRPQ